MGRGDKLDMTINMTIFEVILIVVFFTGCLEGYVLTKKYYQDEAIENGCGQYNPSTGKFE